MDLAAVFREMGYEGTPALWHILLRPLALLGLPILAMSLLSLLIALSSVLLVLRYAPFSTFEKVLLVFGYFLFYEYSILARNYCLTVFFTLLAAALYGRRFTRPVLYALPLVFLANSSLYGFIISFILFLFYWLEFFLVEKRPARALPWSFLLLASAGLAVVAWQVWPPSDLAPPNVHLGQSPSLLRQVFSLKALDTVPNSLISAFLPVPQPQVHFWNTKIAFQMPYDKLRVAYMGTLDLTAAISPIARAVLTMTLPIMSLLPFLAKRFLLSLYAALTFGLLSFFMLVYQAGIRHQGFIFIAFVFCIWIGRHYGTSFREKASPALEILGPALRRGVVPLLFFFPFVASGFAFHYGMKYDFSTGKRAGEYLAQHGLVDAHTLVAAYPGNCACSVLPYMPPSHKKFYFLECREMRSFMRWDQRYLANRTLSVAQIMERIEEEASRNSYNSVLFVTNEAIADKMFLGRFEPVFSPGIAVRKDELFHVYRRKTPPVPEGGRE